MLLFQLQAEIGRLLDGISSATHFNHALEVLSSRMPDVAQQLSTVAQSTDGQRAGAQNLHNNFASLNAITAELSTRELFGSISSVTTLLNQARLNWPRGDEHITALLDAIESFAAAYDRYIRQQTGTHAVGVILHAWDLRRQLATFSGTLLQVKLAIESEELLDEGYGSLTLFLPSDLDLNDVAEKLNALDDIYKELARLFQSHIPLRIRRLEAGSLWTKLIGDTKVH